MKESYLEKKIYYHDTDCGGVVYYANYLKYLEEGRSELFSERGIEIKDLVKKGTLFVVAHIEVDYKAPAHYADKIKVISRIEKLGKSSVHFYQEAKKHETILIEARVVVACVGENLKPKSMPEEMRQALAVE
jgi:acyl-CoA thioester hydrolase